MVPQDPNPIPWGAMDRFQAHYIVKTPSDDPHMYLARTRLKTKGHFASKKLESVSWEGIGDLAVSLNNDEELQNMILKQDVRDANILVEPTDGAVRIHGKWKNHLEFGVTKEQFDIYDRIAGHVKSLNTFKPSTNPEP